MANIKLLDHQKKALKKMHNGCILCGDVGSGKSLTALAYYKKNHSDRKLYIITTAGKRDKREWDEECFDIGVYEYTVDSWNNIKKYNKVYGAFFIFDEQRVVGSGAWVRAFLRIARRNKWILLSATPGDTWIDYIPVFVANGFYKNRTEFLDRHAVYSRFTKYPKIDRFIDEDILEKHRDAILVEMPFERSTVGHHEIIQCNYDRKLYRQIWKDRWDPFKDEPIEKISALFYCLRKVVNNDKSRYAHCAELLQRHPRTIIFYNFNYELAGLRDLCRAMELITGEWNGKIHDDVPTSSRWVYLVQYGAGSEGWNCITSDTMIFFSQNYSYRMMKQASGRIDRMNTPYTDLYYYHLQSKAPIDLAIARAIKNKKKFNERSYMNRHGSQ